MPEICYYASTFISVKETEPMHPRRSQSCPPGGEADGSDHYMSEKSIENYVSKLPGRAFALSFLTPSAASKGSFGHPEFCRRPCLFMKLPGGCPKGAECDYCHLPHVQSVKLDKRQREILHAMSERELLNLMLPELWAHAKSNVSAQEVLVLVEQHLASLPVERKGTNRIPSWKLNQLRCLLRRMSFRRLMLLCPCRKEKKIQAALETLKMGFTE